MLSSMPVLMIEAQSQMQDPMQRGTSSKHISMFVELETSIQLIAAAFDAGMLHLEQHK